MAEINLFINDITRYCTKRITRIQGYANSRWYEGTIISKTQINNVVNITANLEVLNDSGCTITSIRLLDIQGNVACVESCSINKQKGQGVLIKFSTSITD